MPDARGLALMISPETPLVVINGQATDGVSSLDRGLLYGDGVFETLAVEDGQPRFWLRHLARLKSGCGRLGIPLPEGKRLLEESLAVISGVERGVLKIIVTRGCAGRGYRPANDATPTRIIQLHPWPDYPETCRAAGVRVRLCRQRLGYNPALAGIKHLNRLEQVLARGEWDDPGILEGLLLDGDGCLVEGTMSNLFLIRDRVLMTPDLVRCGVAGILRTVVMELAAEVPMPLQIRALGLDDLRDADEVFLTNSIIGIWPVTAVEDRPYRRGVLTCRLQELLKDLSSDGEAWLN
jgi:4-amino-4-deoxychorismate lyase